MKPIEWSAPEFRYYEKTSTWFMWSLIVAVILCLLALWQQNILFFIFVVIAEVLVFYWGRQEPRMISYEMGESGLTVAGNKTHLFTEMEAFSIVAEDAWFELVFKPKRKLAGYIKVFIPAERSESIKEAILDFLPEFEYQESLGEHLMKRIRF